MTPERYSTIRRVLDLRQPDLTLVSDEVHKGRNLSALIRTCDAVGINAFHCVTPKEGFRTFRGTTLGTDKWVDIKRHDNVSVALEDLKSQGFQIVAANLSSRAVAYNQVDYTKPTALLMGAEKAGVSDEALGFADYEVVVPMMGMVESFNVSVAAAIILSEAQRQREKAGLYDTSRLDETTYRQKLFQWCQPAVTKLCDKQGLIYPPLDDTGEIVDAPSWYSSVKAQMAQ